MHSSKRSARRNLVLTCQASDLHYTTSDLNYILVVANVELEERLFDLRLRLLLPFLALVAFELLLQLRLCGIVKRLSYIGQV